MKVLLQRVSRASVKIDDLTVGEIGRGLLLFVGFGRDDSEQVIQPMARKITNMRVFPDENGRFSDSLLDIDGGALLVPQFTLYADTRRGRRPDFTAAMAPRVASALFDDFVRAFRAVSSSSVQAGRFGAEMQVDLNNDGPVTILVES